MGRPKRGPDERGAVLPVLGPLTPFPPGEETAPWHRPKAEKTSASQAQGAKWGKMLHRRPGATPRGALPTQRAQDLGSGEGSRPLGNEHHGWCLVDGKLWARPMLLVITSLNSSQWLQGRRPAASLPGTLSQTLPASMVDVTIPAVRMRKLRHRESQNIPDLCDSEAQSTPTPELGVCWPQRSHPLPSVRRFFQGQQAHSLQPQHQCPSPHRASDPTLAQGRHL